MWVRDYLQAPEFGGIRTRCPAVLKLAISGEMEKFAVSFSKLVIDTLTFHTIRDVDRKERFYKAFVFGMFLALEEEGWVVKVEFDVGIKEFDIIVYPKSNSNSAATASTTVIIKCKTFRPASDSEDDTKPDLIERELSELSQRALEQITSGEYRTGLSSDAAFVDTLQEYGVSFYGHKKLSHISGRSSTYLSGSPDPDWVVTSEYSSAVDGSSSDLIW